jgi:hypothetical protein
MDQLLAIIWTAAFVAIVAGILVACFVEAVQAHDKPHPTPRRSGGRS